MSTAREQAPVGVLDSGLGGLSVLRALRELMPAENFLYCADSGNAPWGDRSADFIIARCDAIADFLTAHGSKAIVLACNTATAVAATHLRERLSLPIIGIEPAVKPAVQCTGAGKVGVLATTRTITSPRYRSLLERFAGDAEVLSQAAPGLMECVERGEFDTPQTRALLSHYLDPMLREGIDTLVLGCTHYPFLIDTIRKTVRQDLTIIEPGHAVARVTQSRLQAIGALGQGTEPGIERFFIKNAPAHAAVLRLLWPRSAGTKPEELAV